MDVRVAARCPRTGFGCTCPSADDKYGNGLYGFNAGPFSPVFCSSVEPDYSLTVEAGGDPPNINDCSDRVGNRYPIIIFEVAYSESLAHVQRKAMSWLDSASTAPPFGVQQVVVVKIGDHLRSDGHRTMLTFRYERGAANNPVQEIEFGPHASCGGATELGMQIYIPASSLYLPVQPSANLPATLPIDLFYVRRIIERTNM